jgi:DNA-binding GntR family transcriptional regulator
VSVAEDGIATTSELAYARVRCSTRRSSPGRSGSAPRRCGRRCGGSRSRVWSSSARRDARVAPLDAAEARDLVELRQDLDPLAAGLAAQRRTAADLAEMADSLARLESLPEDPSPAQLAGHRRFHAALYRASHNAVLVETLDGLWDKTDRYRRHALRAGRSDEEVAQRAEEHRLLVEAVSDRDAAAATELMRRHVESSLAARAAGRLAARDRAARSA